MDAQTRRQKTTRRMIQVLVTSALQGALLFGSAGRLDWIWGWGYMGIYLLMFLVNALILLRINPDVIAERADTAGARGWDMLVGGVFALAYVIGLPLISGLDVRRGWSGEMAFWVHLAGIGVFLIGAGLFVWAMAVNAHFATVVRVGAEGEHEVAMSGPYRIVRHPGYLGVVVQSMSTPLILGSWWALIPAALALVALFFRTVLEDRTLQAELAGYDQLVKQTPYRLIPGIW